MAQAIDTLEIIFAANLGPLTQSMEKIGMQLGSIDMAADIAGESLRNMASALDFSMEGLKKGAHSAGQAVGHAFAKGLRSKKGEVDDAVRYLTAAALEALRRLLNIRPDAAGMADAETAEVTRFDRETLGTGTAAAGGEMNITVPINVDGIRLGEACIRGINAVSRITGRAALNI